MAYSPNDHYARKAKQENYVARSVYKLQELHQKFDLFRPGMQVLDLGCSPGSWSQWASEQIGPKGRILGIDLTKMFISVPGAHFVKADIYTADFPALCAEAGMEPRFHIVMSDMAPATTGSKAADKARSAALCEMALHVALNGLLRPGGAFVCKMLEGPDTPAFRTTLRQHFAKVGNLRPKSTRSSSTEVFFCAQGFKPALAEAPPVPGVEPEAV